MRANPACTVKMMFDNPQDKKLSGGKYAMFFDIDGTLVSFKTHQIPASAILALTQAKANGHKVFIATGRPPLIITNLGAIEHLIDGYVTINGALCFVGDEVVRCKDIPKQDVLTLVSDAQEKNYGVIVVGEKDVAVLDPQGEVDRIFRVEIAVENLHLAKPLDEVLSQRILQLTPFFPESYEAELMSRLPGCTSGRWHPAFTDITAKGADKGEGILTLSARLGLDARYTMVVSLTSMFINRIVFSWILGLHFGMGAIGVWIAMIIDWICRIVFFIGRYKAGTWKKTMYRLS